MIAHLLCTATGNRQWKRNTAVHINLCGFCKSATTEEIAVHSFALTADRYVGAEEQEDNGEPFKEKMTKLVQELNKQFIKSAKLEQAIKANLSGF